MFLNVLKCHFKRLFQTQLGPHIHNTDFTWKRYVNFVMLKRHSVEAIESSYAIVIIWCLIEERFSLDDRAKQNISILFSYSLGWIYELCRCWLYDLQLFSISVQHFNDAVFQKPWVKNGSILPLLVIIHLLHLNDIGFFHSTFSHSISIIEWGSNPNLIHYLPSHCQNLKEWGYFFTPCLKITKQRYFYQNGKIVLFFQAYATKSLCIYVAKLLSSKKLVHMINGVG